MLSDPDKSVSEAYGAKPTGLKKVLPFPKRVTYLIDPSGRVAMGYEVKDIAEHASAVLGDLRNAVSTG